MRSKVSLEIEKQSITLQLLKQVLALLSTIILRLCTIMYHLVDSGLPHFINLRLLLVLSPITVVFAWAMLIHREFNPHNPWRF